tara:strand:- start:14406 stop:14897 length:492 start_codon:yes stop_codon:yes gene_type:complete
MIGIEFDELDEDEVPGLPEEVTPERRTMLLKMRPMLNRWLDGLHKSAYHDANMGNPVPWMKLVDGRSPARKWKENHIHKAETVLVKALADDAYKPPELLSPTQAEKALGKAEYAELLERFVDKGTPAPILVSEDDSRTELKSVADEFEDLDSDDDQYVNDDLL